MGDPEAGPIADGVDHAAAAAAFIRRVRPRYRDEIAALYLFGSTARGDARGLASDVDVLVVIEDDADHEATADGLRDIAYDVMLEYGPVVELHVLSEATFARYRHEGHPFVGNVLAEGVRMPDDMPNDSMVERELEQSRQALSDAETARDAGVSERTVINRLYYACFHATQAVLYDRGLEPTSHGGVLSLFGSEVVAAGDTSREQGRFLNRLSELRKQADYGYEEIDEDVGALLSRSQQFVTEMEALRTDHD